jgi:hypothetical protein
MKGYYYVLDKLKTELETIPMVNTITQGSLDDIDNYKSTIFPLSHIVINNVSPENNILRFNVTIIAMDIVDFNKDETVDIFVGNDNEIDVLNTQLTVLVRMYEVLRRGELNDFLEVDGFPNMEPFTERFENYLAGWTMTLDILIPNEMSIC